MALKNFRSCRNTMRDPRGQLILRQNSLTSVKLYYHKIEKQLKRRVRWKKSRVFMKAYVAPNQKYTRLAKRMRDAGWEHCHNIFYDLD